jgi:hypothetical protein
LLASPKQSGRGPASAPARRTRPMRRLPIVILLALALLAPAAARADGGAQKLLIDACRDEKVDGTYTQAEYKKALDELPADSDEYTACRQVIQDARLAALSNRHKKSSPSSGASNSGGGGGGGRSGSTGGGGSATATSAPAAAADPLATATPAERKAIAKAGETAAPVQIAGEMVRPGELGLGTLSNSDRALPTTLIVALALLAAAALAAGAHWLWTGVLARRLR